MAMIATLVQDQEARDFLSRANLEVGRKAALGDPAIYRDVEGILNHITYSHDAVRNLFDKLGKVINDPTRPTDVEKHAFMKEVFLKVKPTFERAQAAMEKRADAWFTQSDEMVAETFKPDTSKIPYYIETARWMNEMGKTPDGLGRLRSEVTESKVIAITLRDAPSPLIGLSSEVRKNLLTAAIKKFVPDAMTLRDNGDTISALAGQYPPFTRQLERSLFNSALAEKIKLRVEA